MRALIAAAGKGSRAALDYPKTLYPVRGVPILARIVSLLAAVDNSPTIIVSPSGKPLVENCLLERGYCAELIVQDEPKGMGDAVLRFESSPAFASATDVLLIWGDIPLIEQTTLESLVAAHTTARNDFTFVTRHVDSAYTVVSRDVHGAVAAVVETREMGASCPSAGERDIGLFLFRKDPVMSMLKEELPRKFGSITGEHGFLYLIEHLVARGYRVEGLPIGTELDIVSLNSLSDVEGYQ